MSPGAMEFIPNPMLGLLVQEAVEPALKEMGDSKLETARAIAPVDTGEFQASLAGEIVREGGQVLYRLYTTDVEHKVLALEFGTSDTPTFATLRRALDGG